MVDTGGSEQQKKQEDADRERTLQELKAMREKRLESTSTTPGQKSSSPAPGSAGSKPAAKTDDLDLSGARAEEDNAAIAALRASRMQAEAYQDIARLHKQAHAHEHKAAKFMTKSKTFEAKAQKAITRAVQNRERSTKCREKTKDVESRIKDLENELKSAASGETAVTPEKIRLKMAKLEKKSASLKERARKYEAKAAQLNEKAALYRTRAAFNLEQCKIHEAEMRNFTKRADRLEQAGG